MVDEVLDGFNVGYTYKFTANTRVKLSEIIVKTLHCHAYTCLSNDTFLHEPMNRKYTKQGCGVGSPVIRLRLLAISIIRLRPSDVLVT